MASCCVGREPPAEPRPVNDAAAAAAARSPCCPATGHGPAEEPQEYVHKGSMQELNGVPAYVVGSGSCAVVAVHDVFGLHSGRTRQVCDELSDELGVMVVAPCFWTSNGGLCGGTSGHAIEGCIPRPGAPPDSWRTSLGKYASGIWHARTWYQELKTTKWDTVRPRLHDGIIAALKSQGVTKLGLLGFCWGGWVTFRASASQDVACGASCHPSQVDMCSVHGESLGELCAEVRCPQMVLSAGDDKADTKAGGMAEHVFATKPFASDCVFRTFHDMKHGWVNRGELSDPLIARDYKETFDLLVGFFRKHLL